VRDELEAAHRARPAVRAVLLVMSGVNFVDASGAALLAQHATALRDAGVTLYLCKVKPGVLQVLEHAGHLDAIGLDRIFDTKEKALRAIYRTLDARVCAGCEARVFTECHATLPDGAPRDAPRPTLELAPSARR
jgi:SulP family sulfate permease